MGAFIGLISWIFLGLVAGLVAKFLLPGRDPGGCIVTTLIGIAGALLGGFLATQLGYGGIARFDLYGFIVAVLGAVILLLLYRLVFGQPKEKRKKKRR